MCIYIYGAAFSFYFLIFKLIVKMASASHEDGSQKKGVMYVYKMDTGGSNLKPKPDQANPSAAKKANLRGGWGVGLMRRSKTVCEVVVNRSDDEVERGRIEGGGDATTKTMIVEARKSASSATSDPSRKSVSHLELVNVASVAAFLQVKVLVTDMPGFMQVHAFRCARRTYDCLDTFSSKHMAYNIKKEFDKVYGPAWHCIVGSSFGSFVTHSTGGFLYFSMEKLYILVFKTKVQRAVEL